MPGMEAMKLRSNCDIRSLADIPRAAEGAGCEISYVDLPEKISGFAQVIDGQPYIVVNRAKPSKHTTHRILSVKALGDRILLTLALASSAPFGCISSRRPNERTNDETFSQEAVLT